MNLGLEIQYRLQRWVTTCNGSLIRFRISRRDGESKHYRTIQALPLIMGPEFQPMKDYLDNCRRKRNITEYDTAGTVSEKEANQLPVTAQGLKDQVENWLEKTHPELI
jgi:hypothetical protein